MERSDFESKLNNILENSLSSVHSSNDSVIDKESLKIKEEPENSDTDKHVLHSLQCTFCKDRFLDSNILEEHMKECHKLQENCDNELTETDDSINLYQCELCDLIYDSQSLLEEHKLQHHSSDVKIETDENDSAQKEDPKSTVNVQDDASTCPVSFPSSNNSSGDNKNSDGISNTKKSTNSHIYIVLPENVPNQVFEEFCNNVKDVSEDHLPVHNDIENTSDSSNDSSISGTTCSDMKTLNSPIVIDDNKEIVVNSTGSSSTQLTIKEINKEGSTSLYVSTNVEKFGDKSDNSKSSHDTEFSCNECGKVFQHQVTLKDHQKTHSALTPTGLHTCVPCGKQFKTKENLIEHQERRCQKIDVFYTCYKCGECLSSYSLLKSHLKSYLCQQEKYYCPFPSCDEYFNTKLDLQSHSLTHVYGSRPQTQKTLLFSCGKCGVSFLRKEGLDIHMQLHQYIPISKPSVLNFYTSTLTSLHAPLLTRMSTPISESSTTLSSCNPRLISKERPTFSKPVATPIVVAPITQVKKPIPASQDRICRSNGSISKSNTPISRSIAPGSDIATVDVPIPPNPLPICIPPSPISSSNTSASDISNVINIAPITGTVSPITAQKSKIAGLISSNFTPLSRNPAPICIAPVPTSTISTPISGMSGHISEVVTPRLGIPAPVNRPADGQGSGITPPVFTIPTSMPGYPKPVTIILPSENSNIVPMPMSIVLSSTPGVNELSNIDDSNCVEVEPMPVGALLCDNCGDWFSDKDQFTEHMLNVHDSNVLIDKQICEPETIPAVLTTSSGIRKINRNDKSLFCEHCGDCFSNEAEFADHLLFVHNVEYVVPDSDEEDVIVVNESQNQVCNICGETYYDAEHHKSCNEVIEDVPVETFQFEEVEVVTENSYVQKLINIASSSSHNTSQNGVNVGLQKFLPANTNSKTLSDETKKSSVSKKRKKPGHTNSKVYRYELDKQTKVLKLVKQ